MKHKSKFQRIWDTLSGKNKKKIVIASILLFISSVLDLIGVISVLPILLALTNPLILENNEIFLKINSYLKLEQNEFIIFLALCSFVIIILNQGFRVVSKWYSLALSEHLLYEKSRDLFNYYLNKPYKFFLNQNNANLLQKCTNYVNSTVGGHITPYLLIFGSLSSTILIAFFLLAYKPLITIGLILSLFIFYLVFFNRIKKKISKISKAVPNHYSNTAKAIGDAFGSIKEAKFNNNSKFFLNRFSNTASKYRDAHTTLNLFYQLPQASIEIFAFGLLLFIFIFLYFYTLSFNEIIPLIGIIGISLKRLIPAAQDVYAQFLLISFYKESYNKIINDIEKSFTYKNKKDLKSNQDEENQKIYFNKKLTFNKVKFNYDQSKKDIIKVDGEIRKGQFLGICGKSGHGKTTFIDIISSLLSPASGKILIDEKILEKKFFNSWREKISYVPQEGYLLNDTVINNILFGKSKANMKKINSVCKVVNLLNFIKKDLKNSFQSKLGLDGAKVSGGQKQRLIIARALYQDPEILILDESTSALDNINAAKIINNIRKKYKTVTIIFITHRIRSLKNCDNILFFQDGKISDRGKYNYLIKNNKNFELLSKTEDRNLRI